jgi:23S rRNA (uridine2552-2'-O)-methyltransferase
MRLKHGKRLKPSSQRWVARQLKDPFVKKAEADGYRSRAAYKLLELNQKYHLLGPDSLVVDLGAAPGGWSQVVLEILNPKPEAAPRLVGIDLLPMDSLPGALLLQADFTDEKAPQTLRNALQGAAPTLVLSDMAPAMTGHKSTDHLRLMNLAETALLFAQQTLATEGAFAVKLLQGSETASFLQTLRADFKAVNLFKPAASRKESREIYVVAQGFKNHKP